MKLLCCVLALTVAVSAAVFAAAAPRQTTLVVQITDWSGEQTYQAMTPTDLKTLQREISEEIRLMPKAQLLAEREWKKDATYGRKTFPVAAIEKRAAVSRITCATPEDANTKIADLQKREGDRSDREAKRERERLERDRQLGITRTTTQKSQEDKAREAAKDKEREQMYKRALELFLAKLSEVKSAAAAGVQPGAQPPADGKEPAREPGKDAGKDAAKDAPKEPAKAGAVGAGAGAGKKG